MDIYSCMSVAREAEAVAHRAKRSTPLELLARFGFLGYGFTHLLVAWLAFQIATGRPAPEGDQSGALQTMTTRPAGRWLVLAICVGFVAMTIWQLLEAAVGHHGERGAMRPAERLLSAGRALFYGYLGWLAGKVVAGATKTSADSQQSTSAGLLGEPGGQWLVGGFGVGVVCFGTALVVYGLLRWFEKHLRTGEMSEQARHVARVLGVVGYVAKGSAYAVAGLLLVTAATSFDASKARGLDAALRTLAAQRYGPLLLLAMALGIASFAAFCVVQSRYRKV